MPTTASPSGHLLNDVQLAELIYLICRFVDQWGRRPTPQEIRGLLRTP